MVTTRLTFPKGPKPGLRIQAADLPNPYYVNTYGAYLRTSNDGVVIVAYFEPGMQRPSATWDRDFWQSPGVICIPYSLQSTSSVRP